MTTETAIALFEVFFAAQQDIEKRASSPMQFSSRFEVRALDREWLKSRQNLVVKEF
jgi:hypothetical protein